MPTITDVAHKAGVSLATVSRVLNVGSTAPIADATRKKVMMAVEDLDYRPNMNAQAMKSQRSQQIGVLLQNNPHNRLTHPLAWEFVLGINEGLEQGGQIMSLVRMTDVATGDGLQARALRSRLLDGLIVVNHLPDEVCARVSELFPRTIWLDSNLWRDERCIRRDERHAGAEAIRAVVNGGYSEAIYVHPAPGRGHFSANERTAGVLQTAAELELQLQPFEIPHGEDLYNWKNFTNLRDLLRPNIAVIVSDTYAMHALLLRVSRTRLSIGHDFSLLCIDDHFHDNAYHWKHIARVSFDRFGMGVQAAQMMMSLINPTDDLNCPSRLIKGVFQEGTTFSPAASMRPQN